VCSYIVHINGPGWLLVLTDLVVGGLGHEDGADGIMTVTEELCGDSLTSWDGFGAHIKASFMINGIIVGQLLSDWMKVMGLGIGLLTQLHELGMHLLEVLIDRLEHGIHFVWQVSLGMALIL